jgi:hypothetical protein
MVLDAICDDYESVDQVILPHVAKLCGEFGISVERSEVVAALAGLVEDELARAYLLSSSEPAKELQSMPSLDVIEENFQSYFYITKRGMDVHLSDDSWE